MHRRYLPLHKEVLSPFQVHNCHLKAFIDLTNQAAQVICTKSSEEMPIGFSFWNMSLWGSTLLKLTPSRI